MNGEIRTPPSYWLRRNDLEKPSSEEEIWTNKFSDLRVARTVLKTVGDVYWLHVSASRQFRPPSWMELTKVKDEFVGSDREAYQVFGPAMSHSGVHEFCLHLWWPMDGVSRVADLGQLARESNL